MTKGNDEVVLCDGRRSNRWKFWKFVGPCVLIFYTKTMVVTQLNTLQAFLEPTSVFVMRYKSAKIVVEPPSTAAAASFKPTTTTATTVSPEKQQKQIENVVPVKANDYIYRNVFSAPIVIESHKLIFFQIAKVASSTWKKLFLRMEGFDDWNYQNPHVRAKQGLKFLNQYTPKEATHMMNSPDYTRAIFVRDPKDRILSAYLDKVFHSMENPCLPEKENATLNGFLNLIQECPKGCCDNNHWRPQSSRLDEKFVRKLNYVGHLETGYEDAKQLLQQIDAWEEYGRTGWGDFGNESIFERSHHISKIDERHQTGAADKNSEYYTPQLETIVETMYKKDYSMFHLPKKKVIYAAG